MATEHNTDSIGSPFRERIALPVLVPLLALGVIAAVAVGGAFVLLYNTNEGGLALTATASAGILLAFSILANGKQNSGTYVAAAVAGALPMVLGAGLAMSGGGVEDEMMLMVNRQPGVPTIENVPSTTISAVNAEVFESDTMTLAAPEPSDTGTRYVGVVFQNNHPGVQHNWALFPDGTGQGDIEIGAEAAEEALAATELITGVAVDDVVFDAAAVVAEVEAADQQQVDFWFVCTIHPNMNGTFTLTEVAAA